MALKVVPASEMANHIGEKFEPGPWVTLDQERINQFADVTDDHQFIHLDEEKAAQTPFGGTIAHGFLTLSCLVPMCQDTGLIPENVVMGINYGFNKVRFLTPVRAGKRVRAHFEILDIQPKDGNRFLVKQGVSIEIEGEENPALVAEWLNMFVTA